MSPYGRKERLSRFGEAGKGTLRRSTPSACVLVAIIVAGFSAASASFAQVPELPASPPGRLKAIVGGTVLPVATAAIPRGVVLIRGDKIEEVGSQIEVPKGAEVIDATGKFVTPGFVAVEAIDVGLGSSDGNLADGLDPYDLGLRIALASGITTVNLVSGRFGGFFGGSAAPGSGSPSAIIKLAAGDLGAMLVREPGLQYFTFPRRQVEQNLFSIRDGFRRARAYLKEAEEAATRKANAPRMPPEIALYVSIVKNEQPTVVTADTQELLREALALRDEYRFDMILSQPESGYRLARELALRSIPVLLKSRGPDFDFDLTRPVVDEDGLVPVRLPAAYAALGVRVAIQPYRSGISLDGLAGRDLAALPMDAAFAVRGGLTNDEALQAITLDAARVLRVDGRVGSLEKGKDADVLILSGHPLHFLAVVEKALINGKVYYDRAESPLFKPVPLEGLDLNNESGKTSGSP